MRVAPTPVTKKGPQLYRSTAYMLHGLRFDQYSGYRFRVSHGYQVLASVQLSGRNAVPFVVGKETGRLRGLPGLIRHRRAWRVRLDRPNTLLGVGLRLIALTGTDNLAVRCLQVETQLTSMVFGDFEFGRHDLRSIEQGLTPHGNSGRRAHEPTIR